METLEALGRRIATTEDLQSIVRTMKALSSVRIRQYERAATALREYSRTIEKSFQIVLRSIQPLVCTLGGPDVHTTVVVFGSDHGLCGRFNQEIVRHARQELRRLNTPKENVSYLVVGARAASQLDAVGERVEQYFALPGSVDGLTTTAHSLLLKIDALRGERGPTRVLLFNNLREEGGTAAPHGIQLLPLDPNWILSLTQRRWPSRTIPIHTMAPDALFATLVRQHLFIGFFRAGAESGASEHASRLAAMQAAERNIDDHLEEMTAAYRHKRQESITEELMDIVAGFEVLTGADEDNA